MSQHPHPTSKAIIKTQNQTKNKPNIKTTPILSKPQTRVRNQNNKSK